MSTPAEWAPEPPRPNHDVTRTIATDPVKTEIKYTAAPYPRIMVSTVIGSDVHCYQYAFDHYGAEPGDRTYRNVADHLAATLDHLAVALTHAANELRHGPEPCE